MGCGLGVVNSCLEDLEDLAPSDFLKLKEELCGKSFDDYVEAVAAFMEFLNKQRNHFRQYWFNQAAAALKQLHQTEWNYVEK